MAADQAALHRRAVGEFDARVRAVGDDQWELPTPCSDWNVRQLVNHLVYEDRWTVPLMEGTTLAEVGDRYEGDLLGDEPRKAWAESSAEAVAAVQADGALERTVHLSSGPTPATEYVSQLFADHLIHAWDLARAVGADDRLDPELVEETRWLRRAGRLSALLWVPETGDRIGPFEAYCLEPRSP